MQSAPKIVLISVHPRFANLIVSGEKRIEFRRSWTKEEVRSLVIYATAPVMRVVAVASVKGVVQHSPSRLWEVAKEFGGGLTRDELRSYFSGRSLGYGIQLGAVARVKEPFSLASAISTFRPPQSFRYLTDQELNVLKAHLENAQRAKVCL